MRSEKPNHRKGVPVPSSQAASNRMKAGAPRDTAPELALRTALDQLGLAYNADKAILSGSRRRADVVFEQERVAVFVDGCFWHGCPVHGTWPKQNAEFWREKINANRRRDADTNHRLESEGWRVLRVWEHEDPREVAVRIAALLSLGAL